MDALSLEEFSNNSFFEGRLEVHQKVLFGEGISNSVGRHAKELGTHALLVSAAGIREAGHLDRV